MRLMVFLTLIVCSQASLGENTKRLQQEAKALFHRALETAEAGETIVAINLLTEALEKREHPLLYVYRGMLWSQLDKHELCIRDCDRAIELDPKSGEAYQFRAMAKVEASDLDGALADIDLAIALDESDSNGPRWKLIVLVEKGELSDALKQADQLVELERDPDSFIMRGGIRHKLGDERGAKADYEHVLTIDKDNVEAMLYLACVNLNDPESKASDYSRAIELLERSSKLQVGKEGEWEHLSVLAALHAKLSAFENAVELQERVMKLAPQEELAGEGKDLVEYKKELAEKTSERLQSK